MSNDIRSDTNDITKLSAVGIIIPAEWKDSGEVAAIAIATTDERVLLLAEDQGRGRELRRYLRQSMQIHGTLARTEDKRQILVVQDYQPVVRQALKV